MQYVVVLTPPKNSDQFSLVYTRENLPPIFPLANARENL